MEGAMAELVQSDCTLGLEIREDPYHLGVLRSAMNENLSSMLSDILNESIAAFLDIIDSQFTDWVAVSATGAFSRIVSRTICGIASASYVEHQLRGPLSDQRFSDGTTIPAGTMVAVAPTAVHFDEEFYGVDAKEFDGFRFSRVREGQEDDVTDESKSRFTSTGPTYPSFGGGRHTRAVLGAGLRP
ncbi:hypothetical protein C8J56DRAFT_1046452 [Mycena floridula]|nr:hypothetical protein C8J56DRAFT_1046452 [Mycena floridula]